MTIKCRTLTWITALKLFAALATPISPPADDGRDHHHKHHRYHLIDMGPAVAQQATESRSLATG
jgi:hypothetical protein